MKTIDNEQAEKLLEDIASIKKVINKNKSIFQQVVDPTHFRLLSLLFGAGISFFSIMIYFLINSYGSHSAIPQNIKWIVYTAIGVITIILSFMKQRLYRSSVKKIDSNLTLGWLYKELFADRFIYLYLSNIFLIIFLIAFFSYKGIPGYITPAITIWFGIFGFAGAMLHIKHSIVMGYWFFITGIGLTVCNSIHPAIAVFISLGIGFILMGITGYIDPKSAKAE